MFFFTLNNYFDFHLCLCISSFFLFIISIQLCKYTKICLSIHLQLIFLGYFYFVLFQIKLLTSNMLSVFSSLCSSSGTCCTHIRPLKLNSQLTYAVIGFISKSFCLLYFIISITIASSSLVFPFAMYNLLLIPSSVFSFKSQTLWFSSLEICFGSF